MDSTINVYRAAFTRRSALTWLLVANGLMFIGLRLVAAIGMISGHPDWADMAVAAVSLPPDVASLLSQPWTVATYMVSQYDPLHLMFNMLWLAWFGILVQLTLGNRRLLTFYLSGGFAGAAAYLLLSILSPDTALHTGLAGSSAAVISVAVAIAFIEPDHRVGLIFIGPVKLKWVTAIMVIISALMFSGYNAGTDAAHIGGAIAGGVCGLLFRAQRRKRFVPRPFVPGMQNAECRMQNAECKMQDAELLDALLDKIRRSGFNSLSPDERMSLFELSKRLKDQQ